jgi:2-C-methyl-D-erythritol 2,4-cyclodiphosphate synthase
MSSFRVGLGWDVHPFAPEGSGRTLMLGGVAIPHPRGLAGHSDADVVLHAVCDAVLGALGAGDMGRHFPDTDPKYKGMASTEFLKGAAKMMAEHGYRVVNLDLVIVAEEPKVAPWVETMAGVIASSLGCSAAQVNIKAKRAERLGALGRGEGIACEAVALLDMAST